jgi:hypothetical protein
MVGRFMAGCTKRGLPQAGSECPSSGAAGQQGLGLPVPGARTFLSAEMPDTQAGARIVAGPGRVRTLLRTGMSARRDGRTPMKAFVLAGL